MRSRFRRRRKKKQPEPLLEALIAALKGKGLTDSARRLRIFCLWKQAVGKRVAARTEPHAFSRGVLTIRASSAAWQNELTFLKRDLIQKVNAVVGRGTVTDIRIIAGGTRGVAKKKKAPEPLPACTDTEQAQANHVAAEIADGELRDQFAGLMKTFYRARRG